MKYRTTSQPPGSVAATAGRYPVHGALSTRAPRTPAWTATDDPLEASWRVCWHDVVEPRCNAPSVELQGAGRQEAGTGRAAGSDGDRDGRYRTLRHGTCGRDEHERADGPRRAPVRSMRAAASPGGAVWRQPGSGPVLRATRAVGPSERCWTSTAGFSGERSDNACYDAAAVAGVPLADAS